VKAIRGRFTRQLNPVSVKNSWHNRLANSTSPEAHLETNGCDFCITYSQTWDVASLKQTFEREGVQRIDTGCDVTWFVE